MKKLLYYLKFLLGFKGTITKKYVDKNLLDLSGEGRDKYGS